MIVTCEACSTKFRLDPDRLKGPQSKVRCSRCGHVFILAEDEEDVMAIDLPDDADFSAEDPTVLPPPLPRTMSRARPQSASRNRWLIVTAILLILGAGMLALTNYLSSRSPDQTASNLPETPSVKVLENTQAFFLENAHAGQIFVVEGEIENQSAKPVSFILIEGKLYNTTNRVAITQRCYVGNAMTRDELGRLTITEIQNRMMNREGKSLANVKIPPGKRVPFDLVFHNLPELKALSDYSLEVISSKLD